MDDSVIPQGATTTEPARPSLTTLPRPRTVIIGDFIAPWQKITSTCQERGEDATAPGTASAFSHNAHTGGGRSIGRDYCTKRESALSLLSATAAVAAARRFTSAYVTRPSAANTGPLWGGASGLARDGANWYHASRSRSRRLRWRGRAPRTPMSLFRMGRRQTAGSSNRSTTTFRCRTAWATF